MFHDILSFKINKLKNSHTILIKPSGIIFSKIDFIVKSWTSYSKSLGIVKGVRQKRNFGRKNESKCHVVKKHTNNVDIQIPEWKIY